MVMMLRSCSRANRCSSAFRAIDPFLFTISHRTPARPVPSASAWFQPLYSHCSQEVQDKKQHQKLWCPPFLAMQSEQISLLPNSSEIVRLSAAAAEACYQARSSQLERVAQGRAQEREDPRVAYRLGCSLTTLRGLLQLLCGPA